MLMFVQGCSVFSPQSDYLTDYEAAKRSIDGEDGVYRPEGVSADTDYGKSNFLDRVNLNRKRRKDKQLAKELFASAEEQFEEAKLLEGEERRAAFRAAAEVYEKAAKNWQSSALEQDALLMAAESRFFAEDYYRAELTYAELVEEYPRNRYLDHIDSRRFVIADYWLKTEDYQPKPFLMINFSDRKFPWNDTGGHGKRLLEKMRLDNPTGKVSDDATMRLAVEEFSSGHYEVAADTFADLRMTYPDSKHQFNAHFLELQSHLASYQGYQYSSVPLLEAQKLIRQISRQFPNESTEKREELNEAYAKTRFLMAERVWNRAEYRRQREENGAARFHYRRLVNEFADTPFAEEAESKLEEIEGLPEEPPQRFQVLVDLFGGTTDERPWRQGQDAEEP